MSLVLSLFPGIGLLDHAFEEEGFCVVRGPDVLWGGDIHSFHPPFGVFDGLIGGPPCGPFSVATIGGSRQEDLVPEFVRVWEEVGRPWVVMENVLGVLRRSVTVPSQWHARKIRDWDVGGLTHRKRLFLTWPFMLPVYPRRPGKPSPSVLASTASHGDHSGHRGYMKVVLPGDLPIEEYARLQSLEMETLAPLRAAGASRGLLCHLIGNGVPLPMGRAVARAVKRATTADA